MTLLIFGLLRLAASATGGADGGALILSNVNDATIIDVPAVYLWKVYGNGCQYAVRVVNIPLLDSDTLIYARPYYVFEKDGQEIVVYGDVVSRSYDQ